MNKNPINNKKKKPNKNQNQNQKPDVDPLLFKNNKNNN